MTEEPRNEEGGLRYRDVALLFEALEVYEQKSQAPENDLETPISVSAQEIEALGIKNVDPVAVVEGLGIDSEPFFKNLEREGGVNVKALEKAAEPTPVENVPKEPINPVKLEF